MERLKKPKERFDRGQGQIRQLRSGRWIALFPRTAHPDRPSVAPGVTFSSEAGARAALETALAKWKLGLVKFVEVTPGLPAVSSRTVAEVTDNFLRDDSDGLGALQPTTLADYRSDRKRVVCHPRQGSGIATLTS